MIDTEVWEDLNEENASDIVETWSIENDQEADWAIRKINEATAEFERWKIYYTSMIDKAQKRAERTRSFMLDKLRQYFETVPHKETKTMEKYPLPSGELVLKKPKAVWNHDDAQLLEWLKKNGFSEFVKVTEKPDWAGFKKRLVEDSSGIICDSETGLVCDVVTSAEDPGGFDVK